MLFVLLSPWSVQLFCTTGSPSPSPSPRVLNSAPCSLCWYTRDLICIDHAYFCRWVNFGGVPGINTIILALCETAPNACTVCW